MKSSLRITIIYFIISALWITFSDYVVEDSDFRLFDVLSVQTVKGYFFIIMTSVLIYYLIDRLELRQQEELSKRLKKEHELKNISEINERYRHVMEQITQGVVLINPNRPHYPVLFVNKAHERLTGYSEKDVVGREYRLFANEKTKTYHEEMKSSIARQQPLMKILPDYKRDGTFFWNALRLSPIFNQSNQLDYYLGIEEDVTQQQEQHHLIENQLDMFEAVIRVNDEMQLLEYLVNRVTHHLEAEVLLLHFVEDDKVVPLYSKNVKRETRAFFSPQMSVQVIDKLKQEKRVIDVKDIIPDYVKPLFTNESGYASLYSTPVYSEAKEVLGIFVVLVSEDVTALPIMASAVLSYTSIFAIALQKIKFLQKITESERIYRLISEHSSDMIILINERDGIDYMSPTAQNYFGELSDIFRLLMQFPEQIRDRFDSFLRLIKETKQSDTFELNVVRLSQPEDTIEVNGAIFFDHKDLEEKLLLNIRDVTDRKAFEQALNRSLYFDPLTQLPNRFYFKQKLDERVKQHRALSLMIVSLDEMNHIQHAYGEGAMIFILKELSELMSPFEFIDLFARTGEGEFSFILKETNTAVLDQQIDTVITAIEEPWHLNGKDIVTTLSVGVSIFRDQSTDQLLSEAEMALKQAQLDEEVKVHYYHPDQREQSKRQLQIKNDLYYAADYEEFELFYQPIIDVREKKLYGFEALIRWNHQTYGYVNPTEFIPIAEQSGRIVQIGYWVVENACRQLKTWEENGLDAIVSINISYRQIIEEDFVERIKTILKKSECQYEHLVFEITENILMKDIALSNRVLNELKAIGIRISVDDFGIGYSSLSYIKKFPIDILKIDRAFVRNMDEESNDLAIVRAIVEMSRSLDLCVVVEGVETENQLNLLKQLRCRLIQGYYFSKPLPPQEIDAQIKQMNQQLKTS
ncbi:hypothetical protein GCM10012290_22280 [Halolactibacillus alkaliphilus]|uniref:GGDEF domain-containing protein n=1 Tax=Halolactibacillus alkaliphilus TaxID=442899 RepID=A0A511X3S1_9BACI|nr:EAL domain-containing protein [Halolactibacillus alkaliphilus]GEN57602.1 hypothetical protein HAL01_20660 [Halolactibacillus alkaliphilus]GGN74439.1 hypothetical protein GCM10012290_22280 [Halolactibacillus alkaliphilus]SFP01489.1 PAS domain S-box-containing protein/diguanylate cyclase (GGDEF) domain-containing protein [Halolactibacillus alkaliphilus]